MDLKHKISLFLFTLTTFVYGQNRELTDEDYNNGTPVMINFANPETCSEINEWVKSDLDKGTPFLFLQGGIAPIEYSTDKEFQNTYGIYFFDFGCVAPDYRCVVEYNNRIFDYLTEKFDKKWMREIRKDVIGFEEWRKNYRKR